MKCCWNVRWASPAMEKRCLTMLLFVFQFYSVCNFENVSVLDLALSEVKGLNISHKDEQRIANYGEH